MKFSLQNRPGPFIKLVEIPTPDGGVLPVRFSFKYRTRSELAAFNDGYVEAARDRAVAMVNKARADGEAARAKAQAEAEEKGIPIEAVQMPTLKVASEATLAEAINEAGAKYLTDVADGWDLEDPFTPEACALLVDMYADTVPKVSEAYNGTLKGARQGN